MRPSCISPTALRNSASACCAELTCFIGTAPADGWEVTFAVVAGIRCGRVGATGTFALGLAAGAGFTAGLLLPPRKACPDPSTSLRTKGLVEGSKDRREEGSGTELNSKLSREAGASESAGGSPVKTPDAGAAAVATDCFCATLPSITADLRDDTHCHAVIPAISANPIASKGMTKSRLLWCTARTRVCSPTVCAPRCSS